jgi:crotonobetainyl-CoA:carnitine CoA-transferase CaiB-like acyl-CoA transferase
MGSESVSPLTGIRVIDLGLGLSAGIAVKLLQEAGAEIVRLEPQSGDPFYDVYPAYRVWQEGKTRLTLTNDQLQRELATADICVVGGEAWPKVERPPNARELSQQFPSLVILEMTGAPAGGDIAEFPAVELLAQARSGVVFEHFPDRPAVAALPMSSYGAAFHGIAGVLAALRAREVSGEGDVVTVSLLGGALRWCASIWCEVEKKPRGYDAVFPRGMVPMRFKCADGRFVGMAPGVAGFFARLNQVLGIEDPSADPDARGGPKGGSTDPSRFFGDLDRIAQEIGKWTSEAFFTAIREAELPGDMVCFPGEAWDDPQTRENDLIRQGESGWSRVGSPFSIATTGSIPNPSSTGPGLKSDSGNRMWPLRGVRVLDFGSFAAGPHASVMLGDLGADVIKVERIEGDPMRAQFHHYVASNRGKRSVAVDAKRAEGREIIERLCRKAHAVHHNFRPGVSARLGLDADSLKEINPALVVLESFAYGKSGPKASRPGFDSIFQGVCGHQYPAGGRDNPPSNYRFAPIDYGTAMLGAVGLMLGLIQARRSQTGSEIHTSLLNAGIYMMSELVRTPLGDFVGNPAVNGDQLGWHPAERLYQTRDGWIAIAARGNEMAGRLIAALGLTGRICDVRSQWGEQETALLGETISAMSTDALITLLRDRDVWGEPCSFRVDPVLGGKAAEASDLVWTTHTEQYGAMRQIGRIVSFQRSALPSERDGRADVDPVGGHSREILLECGYRHHEIEVLFANGVVA